MEQKLDSIRVGALDPNDPEKQPSETVTITIEVNNQRYQILLHSPEGVDELIKLLSDAKKEAWETWKDGAQIVSFEKKGGDKNDGER